MDCKSRWGGDMNGDASVVQNYSRFWLVNEIVEKTKGLGVCLQRRKRLRFPRFSAFVRSKEINPQTAPCGIAGDAPSIYNMRHSAERLVYLFQDVENWGVSAIFNGNGDIFELRYIHVASLKRSPCKSDPQHRWIRLKGNGAHQHAAQPKNAGLSKGCEDVADFWNGARKPKGSYEC